MALNWLSNRHHNNDQGSALPSADDIAAAQAAIAQANQAFSDQVNIRNALTSGSDPSTLASLPGQGSDDPMVALRNQLTAGANAPQQAPLPYQAPSEIDFPGNSATSGSSAGVPSAPSQDEPEVTSPDPQALQTAMAPPPNSPLASSFSNSSDDPTSTQPTTLSGVMDSIKDSVTSAIGNVTTSIQDGYDSVMGDLSSLKQTASSLWNDPSVQFLNQMRKGDYTTAPAVTTRDTPDQAVDKTFGQAVLGFGDFKDGIVKGLNNYDTKMVNQMGGYLGMANVQIGGQSQ
jgi:hypothetical protein